MLGLVGCECEHKWESATCEKPQTCRKCGSTQGKALSHDFSDESCTSPKICSLCKKTEGYPLGHTFTEATCTSAMKCSVCGTKHGSALGHDFAEATYEKPETCTRCNLQKGEKLELSESCEKVLAEGVDESGNVYELVANDEETYSGVVVKVGIIKNSEWLIEPTTDIPFVDDDGTLYGTDVSDLSTAPETIYYIGNNCFLYRNVYEWGTSGETYEEVVFNFENGKHYELYTDKKGSRYPTYIDYTDYRVHSDNKLYDYGRDIIISNDELVIWQAIEYDRGGSTITFLNTTTMQTHKIKIGSDLYDVKFYPLGDGMFAITSYQGVFRFYDIDGNIVLDLSDYKLTHRDQPLVFDSGVCTFTIYNNAKNIYRISVDRDGNVIDSEKL